MVGSTASAHDDGGWRALRAVRPAVLGMRVQALLSFVNSRDEVLEGRNQRSVVDGAYTGVLHG